jgi:hypothetical protein
MFAMLDTVTPIEGANIWPPAAALAMIELKRSAAQHVISLSVGSSRKDNWEATDLGFIGCLSSFTRRGKPRRTGPKSLESLFGARRTKEKS